MDKIPINSVREKTVCFTGHRPEKLPDGGDVNSPAIKRLKSLLYAEIMDAADQGFDTFVTGMQRGIDLWAGEAVMSAAAARGLKLIAVLPYRDMGKGYKGSDKWLFGRIMDLAHETVIISEKYTPACMTQRNRLMVDSSSRIIAVIDNEHSGTGQTLRYARSQGLEIRRIDISAVTGDQLTLL